MAGDMAKAAVDTVTGTRRFVRRQRSWFRRDKRITWLDGGRPDVVASALHVIRA
jgi:tRNA dimethylallyltransferase